MKTSIAIVEDDIHFRNSLTRLVGTFSDCECVGAYPNATEAIVALPSLRPRVVMMDINLPGLSGIQCVSRLKPLMPDTEFVMLTAYEDSDLVFTALSAGASGYLLKQAGLDEIHASIRQVADGGAPMSAHIARKVVLTFRPPSPQIEPPQTNLTTREAEILGLLGQGLLYKEIADRLSISYATVNNHVRHIYEKLHVNSRSQAVAKYFNTGGFGIEKQ